MNQSIINTLNDPELLKARQFHLDRLARLYASGEGVAQDLGKAVGLLSKAAQKEDAEARCRLGECYETGNGVKKDFEAAFLWFCKAVTTAPEDDRLYQSVQNHVFDPNLKECREQLLSERSNKNKQ